MEKSEKPRGRNKEKFSDSCEQAVMSPSPQSSSMAHEQVFKFVGLLPNLPSSCKGLLGPETLGSWRPGKAMALSTEPLSSAARCRPCKEVAVYQGYWDSKRDSTQVDPTRMPGKVWSSLQEKIGRRELQ